VLGTLSQISEASLGVFRGRDAVDRGVTRKQLARLHAARLVERVLADTYRLSAVPRSSEQELHAALLWAGDDAAAAGRLAGALYWLEGVRAETPEIVVPRTSRVRSPHVIVYRTEAHRYDFAFPTTRTIVETNGRRWHDDPLDYEHDNEKWSVPGRTAIGSCSQRGQR